MKLHPGKVKFKIAQGGAQVGINDVSAGRVSIADVSRDPLPAIPRARLLPDRQVRDLRHHEQIRHARQPTSAQLVDIFTGKTRSWSGIPGATATGTIDLISRTSVAGVLTSFQTLLLENKKVASLAQEESSEGLLRQAVENDPNSIGFVSNYQSDKGGVNAVGINGVRLQQEHGHLRAATRVSPASTRSPRQAATGCRFGVHRLDPESPAAAKIISTQWVPITEQA